MYNVNGISVHDAARGWTLLDSSDLRAGASLTRASLTRPGVDGSVPMPGFMDPTPLGLSIGCTRSTLDALMALFLQPSIELSRAGTYGTAAAELKALTPVTITGGLDPVMELKVVLSLPGVWFRGDVETFTHGPGFLSPIITLETFPGISGKVTDALIRFSDVTNITVTDAGGSFIRYAGTVAPDVALRVDTATGRGWLSALDAWNGGTEIDPTTLTSGRGPGFLAITPSFTDPAARIGALTVSVDDRGPNATIDVQGRNAFNV